MAIRYKIFSTFKPTGNPTPTSLNSILHSDLKNFTDSRLNGVYIKAGHATLFLAEKLWASQAEKQDNIHNMVSWPCSTNTNIPKKDPISTLVVTKNKKSYIKFNFVFYPRVLYSTNY